MVPEGWCTLKKLQILLLNSFLFQTNSKFTLKLNRKKQSYKVWKENTGIWFYNFGVGKGFIKQWTNEAANSQQAKFDYIKKQNNSVCRRGDKARSSHGLGEALWTCAKAERTGVAESDLWPRGPALGPLQRPLPPTPVAAPVLPTWLHTRGRGEGCEPLGLVTFCLLTTKPEVKTTKR